MLMPDWTNRLYQPKSQALETLAIATIAALDLAQASRTKHRYGPSPCFACRNARSTQKKLAAASFF
jgi:hypothetical protein